MKKNSRKLKYKGYLFFLFVVLSVGVYAQNSTNNNEKEISYADLVGKLTDMKAIAELPEPGEKSEMWSSYDRDSKIDSAGNFIDWAANIDGLEPQYIRKEGENEVLAEMEEPGAIVRIWSASPKEGKVKIYIDGKEMPVINESFIDYFSTDIAAFDFNQLVYETSARGYNNYVPIPYNKSCKIVAEPGWGQYYQFNYISFPNGTKLEQFDPQLKQEHQAALAEANTFFNNKLGSFPYASDDFEKTSKEISLKPGEKATAIKLQDAGAISAMKIRVKDRDSASISELLRKTSIEIKWDGKEEAAVWSPLGDFFGTSPGWNEYKTLPMGMTEDWMYAYWYMPFSKGAELIFENKFDEEVRLELEIKHEKINKGIEKYARFHAKWHRNLEPLPEDRWPDWKLLETKGKGRFVGTHLLVWNPKGGSCSLAGPGHYWWGEGDEKFFIDGENFPSTFGTGTEDYFGYAWCDPSEFQRAYHSQTQDNANMGYQPMNRWHIIDNIPFQESFDGYLEKYFPNEWPTQYATIVYWYLDPEGEDYLEEVPMEERYGYETPYDVFRKEGVVEAESLNIKENSGGWANNTDAFANEKLYNEVSGHKMLFWVAEKGKENMLNLRFTWPESGNYTVYGNFINAVDGGSFRINLNGDSLGFIKTKSSGDKLEVKRKKIGEVELNAGVQELKIKREGTEDTRETLRLDYLEFVEK